MSNRHPSQQPTTVAKEPITTKCTTDHYRPPPIKLYITRTTINHHKPPLLISSITIPNSGVSSDLFCLQSFLFNFPLAGKRKDQKKRSKKYIRAKNEKDAKQIIPGLIIKYYPKATYNLASHFQPMSGCFNPVMREITFLLGRRFPLGNRFSSFACWEKRKDIFS